MNELNLNVLEKFNKNYSMRLGYSDHSADFITPIIATSKNIKFIEVHVTKSNKLSILVEFNLICLCFKPRKLEVYSAKSASEFSHWF